MNVQPKDIQAGSSQIDRLVTSHDGYSSPALQMRCAHGFPDEPTVEGHAVTTVSKNVHVVEEREEGKQTDKICKAEWVA